MKCEIERRYLLTTEPEALHTAAIQHIRQGYLVISSGEDIRIRDHDGMCTLCVKRGTGLSRQEVEVTLDREGFERLWPLTEGRRVEKQRRDLTVAEVAVSVDDYSVPGVFRIAEIEFSSEASAQAFVPPDWLGLEVTALATPQRLGELMELLAAL